MHSIEEVDSVLSAAGTIPKGYISFDIIYEPVKTRIDRASAKRRLARAGYRWCGLYEEDGDAKFLQRYYEPSAQRFFVEKQPLPPVVTAELRSESEAAAELGIPMTYIRRLRTRMEAEAGIVRVPRLNKKGRVYLYYTDEAIEWLAEEKSKAAIFDETASNMKELAKHLCTTETKLKLFLTNYTAIQSEYGVRQVPNKPDRWGNYFTKEQVGQLGVAYGENWADPTHWTLQKVADEAGVKISTVKAVMNVVDQAAVINRRGRNRAGDASMLDHLPEDHARKLVERIKDSKLGFPAHVLPFTVARKVLSQSELTRQALPTADVTELRRFKGGKIIINNVITWESLRELAKVAGWANGLYFAIDYDRLPSQGDDDPAKNIYARAVQLTLQRVLSDRPAEQLGNPDGIID